MPEWMSSTTVLQVIAALSGIGVLVGIWKTWLGGLVRAFSDFMEDWLGIPDRPGVPGRRGVMATLQEHGVKIAEIQSQVTPNHGSTLKLSEELQGLRKQVCRLTEAITGEPECPDTPLHSEDELISSGTH